MEQVQGRFLCFRIKFLDSFGHIKGRCEDTPTESNFTKRWFFLMLSLKNFQQSQQIVTETII